MANAPTMGVAAAHGPWNKTRNKGRFHQGHSRPRPAMPAPKLPLSPASPSLLGLGVSIGVEWQNETDRLPRPPPRA